MRYVRNSLYNSHMGLRLRLRLRLQLHAIANMAIYGNSLPSATWPAPREAVGAHAVVSYIHDTGARVRGRVSS